MDHAMQGRLNHAGIRSRAQGCPLGQLAGCLGAWWSCGNRKTSGRNTPTVFVSLPTAALGIRLLASPLMTPKCRPDSESQANGGMMRISPLGIFGANHDMAQVAEWARQDAALTHPHPICQQANALFAMASAQAIRTGTDPQDLYRRILVGADDMKVDKSLLEVIIGAAAAPPANYVHHQGGVLIAFHNALWQLLHAPNLEEGIVPSCEAGIPTPTPVG